MDFRTEIFPLPAAKPIGHTSTIVSVGSCFAERMGDRLRHYKFRLLQNPFGIIFHPQPLIAPLQAALSQHPDFSQALFLHDGKWRHLAFHSKLSHHDRAFLEVMIQGALQATQRALTQADLVIITLGSAIGFWHKASARVVANCHKLPQQDFEARMSRVTDLKADYAAFFAQLFALNPKVQVLLTVSPVRHLRAGLVDNAGSKAVLRALCQELTEDDARVHYFPAWELLMDDLRDYRFYGRDLAHPSEMAEDYVGQKFCESWISTEAREINGALDGLFRDLAHRPVAPKSEAHRSFLQKLRDRIDRLRAHVDLDLELRDVEEQLGLR
jgi:GSCFA family